MSFLAGFIKRQFIRMPPVPTESFAGKTIVVTGGNSGLGFEAARWLIQLGADKIVLAVRNLDKGKAAAADLLATTAAPTTNGKSTSSSPGTDAPLAASTKIEVWQLDMNSYASVLSFADRATRELPRLDGVVASAGLMSMTFRPTETDEETVTTNVVSTALLACALSPALRATAARTGRPTYFSVVGSELYVVAGFREREGAAEGGLFAALADERKARMMDRYNVSKLLVLAAVRQMAAAASLEGRNVVFNVVAPG